MKKKTRKIAYFQGCKIPLHQKAYGKSVEAVMGKLKVKLIKLPFNCCGYPSRGEHFETSMLSAIRNFAIAKAKGLDILTPCKCCFGQMKHAAFWWARNEELKRRIEILLTKEGLFWDGNTKVKHLLSFLYEDIGISVLKGKIQNRLPREKVVLQYGCHALRPFSITGFDNPNAPGIFEALIQATGFDTIDWEKKTECCGNPVLKTNKALSKKILENKLSSARETGAKYIVNACTHCQIQYDIFNTGTRQYDDIIPLLFPQLLGMALGIRNEKLST
ncbi:MAG: disulfide reductase [Desulfobacteraceae bacterium]|nr:disulfide reductase [Desulfobacteraceae bacterium]